MWGSARIFIGKAWRREAIGLVIFVSRGIIGIRRLLAVCWIRGIFGLFFSCLAFSRLLDGISTRCPRF
jgi:hypothetical protein